jgi:acetyl esterase
LLIYPACDFDQSRPSYTEDPLLKVAGCGRPTSATAPMPSGWCRIRSSPRWSPNAMPASPPGFVGNAQYDSLRDRGQAYADKLEAAGVVVEVDVGGGLIYGYMRSMDYCPDAEAKLRHMARWLASRLA